MYGDSGCLSDGGVLFNSTFGILQAISDGLMVPYTFLPSRLLPGTFHPSLPYIIVGDEAKNHMMRPYPGRNLTESQVIFNYRLSRARMVIENTFGKLASRWRIFRIPILLSLIMFYTQRQQLLYTISYALRNHLFTALLVSLTVKMWMAI